MKKNIKFILILIIVVLIGVILGTIFFKTKHTNHNSFAEKYSCLAKGKKCSNEDIIDGMLLTVPVNKKQKVEFYVLSDTKDTMTLITKELYGNKVRWGEYTNQNGPVTLVEEIYKITKDWTNIPVINEFSYDDLGYKHYRAICNNGKIEEKDYRCNDIISGVGYRNLTVSKGKVYIVNSDNTINYLKIENMRARTVTNEEVANLSYISDNQKIDWLYNGLYWSLSSVTESEANYFTSAYVVSNFKYEGTPNFTTQNINLGILSSNVQVRPVITIAKYTDK